MTRAESQTRNDPRRHRSCRLDATGNQKLRCACKVALSVDRFAEHFKTRKPSRENYDKPDASRLRSAEHPSKPNESETRSDSAPPQATSGHNRNVRGNLTDKETQDEEAEVEKRDDASPGTLVAVEIISNRVNSTVGFTLEPDVALYSQVDTTTLDEHFEESPPLLEVTPSGEFLALQKPGPTTPVAVGAAETGLLQTPNTAKEELTPVQSPMPVAAPLADEAITAQDTTVAVPIEANLTEEQLAQAAAKVEAMVAQSNANAQSVEAQQASEQQASEQHASDLAAVNVDSAPTEEAKTQKSKSGRQFRLLFVRRRQFPIDDRSHRRSKTGVPGRTSVRLRRGEFKRRRQNGYREYPRSK